MTFRDHCAVLRGVSLIALVIVAAAVACVHCAALERGEPLPTQDAGATNDSGGTGEKIDANVVSPTDGAGIAPSFAKDIHPLLMDGCASCHATGGTAKNTDFILTGAVAADLQEVLQLVNKQQPTGSRLLSKASGQGHSGGAIYAAGSSAYEAIVHWISAGTPP